MQMDTWRNNMVGCHCEPLFPLSLRAKGVAISVGGIQWHLRNNTYFVVGLISIAFLTTRDCFVACAPRNDRRRHAAF